MLLPCVLFSHLLRAGLLTYLLGPLVSSKGLSKNIAGERAGKNDLWGVAKDFDFV